jgi:hypothetical protein
MFVMIKEYLIWTRFDPLKLALEIKTYMEVPTLMNTQNVGMHLGVCGFLMMLVGYIGGCQLTTWLIVRYA